MAPGFCSGLKWDPIPAAGTGPVLLAGTSPRTSPRTSPGLAGTSPRTGPRTGPFLYFRACPAGTIVDSNHFQLHPTPVPSAGGWDGRQRVGGFILGFFFVSVFRLLAVWAFRLFAGLCGFWWLFGFSHPLHSWFLFGRWRFGFCGFSLVYAAFGGFWRLWLFASFGLLGFCALSLVFGFGFPHVVFCSIFSRNWTLEKVMIQTGVQFNLCKKSKK